MRRLIKRRARQFVAASADPSLDIRFAGLIPSRRQTQVSANIPRFAEPLRLVDRCPESESRQGADTRSAHQAPTDGLVAHDVENLFGQSCELAQHHTEYFQQRLDHE